MKGVNHYLRDGTLHTGKTHNHKDGSLMTGATMSKTSQKLFHYKERRLQVSVTYLKKP